MEAMKNAVVYALSCPVSSIFTVLALITLFVGRRVMTTRAMRRKIQATADEKIADVLREREEAIEWAKKEGEKISEAERIKIERMDFKELRDALQSGAVTAENAVRVYFGLAVRAHERTNCLTNIVKKSLDEAREWDKKAKNPAFKKPSLFGIPISIKESIELEGSRCTWGLVQKIDFIPQEDSYPVMKLRQEGMIPFCQSNVPTSCMTYTCSNSIYGTTSCPVSSSRTSGGSSGGEGALIGARGSLVGMGSDLGGSIRIPAAYSGCCGFKPSSTRFSTLQMGEPIPFRPLCMPTEGPLAQDPHALVAVMRAIWSDLFISNFDALSVPVNFREELFKQETPCRIGYYTSDGYIDPLPGNQRVVREAVEVLGAKGYEVVPFSLGDIVHEATLGLWGSVFADGGARQAEMLRDEPLSPMMEPLRTFGTMHNRTKRALGVLYSLVGDKNTGEFLSMQPTSASDMQRGIDLIYASRKRLVKKMKTEGIGALLCPATISPAMPHSLPHDIPFTAMSPTILFNALDFPAGVVTTGSWTAGDEEELAAYPEKGSIEKGIKRGCKGSVGLPLAVQVVAPPFRDEVVLRIMVDLFEALK